jgi:YggT family protein
MQSLFYTLARSEVVSVGSMLASILGAIWTIISFIIGFYMVIIVLRAIAYITSRNIYNPFWQTVDNIYQPFMYKMNRIIFGNKIGHFLKGMIITFLLLLLLMFGGRILINLLINFLNGKFII